MSSLTINQARQIVKQLNWSEQCELLQLLLQDLQQRWHFSPQTPNITQVKKLRGKYAFVPTSSELFAQKKQYEIELEGGGGDGVQSRRL